MKIKKLSAVVIGLAVVLFCGATFGIALGTNADGTALAYNTTISEWGIEHFNQLDCGLYWYVSGSRIPTSEYSVKKDAPTVIFAHGLKKGEGFVREDLSIKNNDSDTTALLKSNGVTYEYDPYFYDYYVSKGYNGGMFYWN